MITPPAPPPFEPPAANIRGEERQKWREEIGEDAYFDAVHQWQQWAAKLGEYARNMIRRGVSIDQIPSPTGGFIGDNPENFGWVLPAIWDEIESGELRQGKLDLNSINNLVVDPRTGQLINPYNVQTGQGTGPYNIPTTVSPAGVVRPDPTFVSPSNAFFAQQPDRGGTWDTIYKARATRNASEQAPSISPKGSITPSGISTPQISSWKMMDNRRQQPDQYGMNAGFGLSAYR